MMLFHLNFYRTHLLYFILVIIVSSGIFYGSSEVDHHVPYVDALYLCTSAMCNVEYIQYWGLIVNTYQVQRLGSTQSTWEI